MSMAQTDNKTGGCLCGAIRYEIDGPLKKVVYCHCEQCRKSNGHFVAATSVAHEYLHIEGDSNLTWFQSSDIARRGFCNVCGSSLFWEPSHGKYMGVWAGTIDAPTGLTSHEHIYGDDASDYYELTDGLPQFPQDHPDLWEDN